MDGAPPAALQRRRKNFPSLCLNSGIAPAGEISVGDIRQVPGVLLDFGCPPSETDCRPSVGRISRSDIRQAQPHSSTSSRGRESHPCQAGFGSPTPDSGNEKAAAHESRAAAWCRGYPGLRRAASLRNSERCAARRSSSGPCPSGRWRTVAWVRRIWRMKRRQCRHMSRWLRTASCPRKSSCPSRKSLDRATSSLQLSIGRSPRNAPGWRRPSGGRDAAAPGHWKA